MTCRDPENGELLGAEPDDLPRVDGLTLTEWMDRLAVTFRDGYKTPKEHWSTLSPSDWAECWYHGYAPEEMAEEEAELWE